MYIMLGDFLFDKYYMVIMEKEIFAYFFNFLP